MTPRIGSVMPTYSTNHDSWISSTHRESDDSTLVEQEKPDGSATSTVLGCVIAVCIVCIIGVASFILIKKKRISTEKTSKGSPSGKNIHEAKTS